MNKIPIYKPYLDETDKQNVMQAVDSGWISSKGEFIEKFETNFAKYVSRKHALTVCNGTVALHLALESLGLKKNTAVLCPTLTYVSTANAIRYAGLIPVFMDCDDKYCVSTIEELTKTYEKCVKNNIEISAIMSVHLYGNMSNIIKENIKNIDVLSELPIIEDCAESFGSKINNKNCGNSDSEFCCFSFFGNKTITTGEGGMIVCSDDALYNRAKMLRSVGQYPNIPQRYFHHEVGYNYRMTNITASIGVSQLEKAEKILNLKHKVYQIYKEHLSKANLDILLKSPENVNSSNWLITIFANNSVMRDGLMLYLESKNIETRPAFLPMHVMRNLKPFYAITDFPNAEKLSETGINLPSYPELSEENIKYICEMIIEYYREYDR